MKKTAAKKVAKTRPTAKKAVVKKVAKAKPAAKKAAVKKVAKAKPAVKKVAKAKPAVKKVVKATPTAKKVSKAKKAAKARPAVKKVAARKVAKARPAGPSEGETRAGSVREPEKIAELIVRVEALADEAGVELPPGASAREIARAEKALGVRLPDEVRAWYSAHDGGGDAYILEGREFLSLERIVGEWTIWKDLLDSGTFDEARAEPDPGVQDDWWAPEWIPVTYDGAGNHHVLDLAPAEGGTHGQILSFWHDDAQRTIVARSFLEWLAAAEWGERDD